MSVTNSEARKQRALSSKLYQQLINDPRVEEIYCEEQGATDEDGEEHPSMWWLAVLQPGFRSNIPTFQVWYDAKSEYYDPHAIATLTLGKMLEYVRQVVACECKQCQAIKAEVV